MRTISAILGIALLAGCASLGKVGDGKLEPTTKKAVSLAATAAGIAAPEYAGAIDAVRGRLAGEAEAVEPTDIPALMEAAGFVRVYTVFFDGIAINDHSRFSFREAWERSGTGATVSPSAMIPGAEAPAQEAESAIDARIDAAMERIATKRKGK